MYHTSLGHVGVMLVLLIINMFSLDSL